MRRRKTSTLVCSVICGSIAGSLLFGTIAVRTVHGREIPTPAEAAVPPPVEARGAAVAAPTSSQGKQVNPWAILAAMTPGPSAKIMCGSAAATSATSPETGPMRGCVLPLMDAPPSPQATATGTLPAQPLPASRNDPLLMGLIAIASTTGTYLAFHANDSNPGQSHPVSPD